jgi:hypothetical protein
MPPDSSGRQLKLCGGACLDAQVLLDPIEEQFHLPSAFVELGDGDNVDGKIIGEEHQSLAGLWIVKLDPAKRTRKPWPE